jgi:hypothetical protein
MACLQATMAQKVCGNIIAFKTSIEQDKTHSNLKTRTDDLHPPLYGFE